MVKQTNKQKNACFYSNILSPLWRRNTADEKEGALCLCVFSFQPVIDRSFFPAGSRRSVGFGTEGPKRLNF